MTVIADDALTDTCLVECADCGDSTSDPVTTESGSTVCNECADENYVECSHCCLMTDDHESVSDNIVCRTCLRDSGDFFQCYNCEAWTGEEGSTRAYDEDTICCRCHQDYYRYCENCDYAVRSDDSDHDHGCACEAPSQSFRIRNDGQGMLDNDARAIVSLPSGVISNEGLDAIACAIRAVRKYDDNNNNDHNAALYHVSYALDTLDPRWQTREGNFTKRLSRHAYKKHNLKLSPDLVSEIGNLARAHSSGPDYAVEFTRQLNLPPEDFYNEGSCWWQSYSESRCALKANGGVGMRTFDGCGVTGRAWIMPLAGDELTATHNVETATAYVVFNGYGDLTGYVPARILAHMVGMTYRKIALYADPMYINGGAGYLVAPEDIATVYTDGSLTLSLKPCS